MWRRRSGVVRKKIHHKHHCIEFKARTLGSRHCAALTSSPRHRHRHRHRHHQPPPAPSHRFLVLLWSMGSFVRQRLISHLSRGDALRSCPRVVGFPVQGYGNVSRGYATESGQDEASSSWFQRLKGVFKGKASSETSQPPQGLEPKAPSSKVLDPTATLPGDFTMENFADELKKARQFGSMTTFGRGLPRGGEMSAVNSLQRQEDILRALHKRDPMRVGAQQKADVAAECGCTLFDVENVVSKYEWAKEANRRVKKLEAEGKPLPKTLNEVEALMGGSWSAAASVNLSKSGNISRNAPCPCGSKKKYKRCCGKNAVEA